MPAVLQVTPRPSRKTVLEIRYFELFRKKNKNYFFDYALIFQ